MWTYRCYDDGRQPHLWQRWYNQNVAFRGTHDSIFEMIEQMDAWREPHVKPFDKGSRIFEVRLNGNVKHRILGMYGTSTRREFIVLGVCFHKQSNYYPPGIRKVVRKRKLEVENDIGKAPHCVRPQ